MSTPPGKPSRPYRFESGIRFGLMLFVVGVLAIVGQLGYVELGDPSDDMSAVSGLITALASLLTAVAGLVTALVSLIMLRRARSEPAIGSEASESPPPRPVDPPSEVERPPGAESGPWPPPS